MIFPLPVVTPIGNANAMANTFPDAIKQHTWLLGESFESYTGQGFTYAHRYLFNYATYPLEFFPGILSYENNPTRLTWVNLNLITHNAHKHSGAVSLLIRTLGGDGHACVNHGYWSELALTKKRTWKFWLKLPTLTHDGFIDFAFDNYANDYATTVGLRGRNIKGYFIFFRGDTNYFNLYRSDGNSYVALATHTLSPAFNNDWKEIIITELNGNIKIYYDGNLKIDVNDSTYRNCNWFGARSRNQSDANIAYLDDLIIG